MAKTTQLIFEILEAEKERLFQYASYRLHNISDVEDVLQNLYVKVLEHPNHFNHIVNKRAYLFRIICNECTDTLKSKANLDLLNNGNMASIDIETIQSENFDEEFKIINSLLNSLPPEQSDAIRLRHHSNYGR